jgi:hypothetical protein
MRTIGLAAVLALAGGQAGAETITFEADGEVVFIRCVDSFTTASCEMIFPPGTSPNAYLCLALDNAGQAIAAVAAPGFVAPSGVRFPSMPIAQIASVRCRRR